MAREYLNKQAVGAIVAKATEIVYNKVSNASKTNMSYVWSLIAKVLAEDVRTLSNDLRVCEQKLERTETALRRLLKSISQDEETSDE